MNIVPSIVEKTYNGNISYDLYSKLLNDRIIFVNGEINQITSNIIVSELLYLDSISHEDIFMYINSPGGSVTDGLAIYDTMNYIKSDVNTIAIGIAASMASIILANGTKGKRLALTNSEIMIHEVLGGAKGQATEVQIEAERILKTRDKLNKILSKLTNKPLKKVSNDTKRDKFMDADEALKYGLIDKICK